MSRWSYKNRGLLSAVTITFTIPGSNTTTSSTSGGIYHTLGNYLDQLDKSSSLYPFTTATFTPGGATGRFGPTITQARTGITAASGIDWTANTSLLNIAGTNGGIILWTVPSTATYSIDCYGAQGGYTSYYASNGGLGARIKGDFNLTQGQVLAIVVGQEGQSSAVVSESSWGGGGGGGTFVWINGQNTNPLIVAGGGGCGGTGASTAYHGQTGTSGGAGSNNGAPGGTNGNSGTSGVCGGGNGQGWLGGVSYTCGGSFTWVATYVNPTGHSAYPTSAVGGFGGGGGSYGGGGGGGGYSGGGSAGWSYSGAGGGGGSYNSGSNKIETSAVQSGHGKVIITKL